MLDWAGLLAYTAGYTPVVRGWAGRQGRVVPQELGVEGGVAVAGGPRVRPSAATTDLLGEPVGVALAQHESVQEDELTFRSVEPGRRTVR